jgi:hypothetical protein
VSSTRPLSVMAVLLQQHSLQLKLPLVRRYEPSAGPEIKRMITWWLFRAMARNMGRWWMRKEQWCNDVMMINSEKLKISGQICSSATSSTMNLIWNHPGLNPGVIGGKPAFSLLSYVTTTNFTTYIECDLCKSSIGTTIHALIHPNRDFVAEKRLQNHLIFCIQEAHWE